MVKRMRPDEVLIPRLIDLSIPRDIVVIARESESLRMITNELSHRIRLILPRRTTMNNN